jgi:hypothetical protein
MELFLWQKKVNPIYQQALGYADYNSKRMLNDSSVFELASFQNNSRQWEL